MQNLQKFYQHFEKRVAKSAISAKISYGGIAQLGEHMHHTHGVAGSSPVVSTVLSCVVPCSGYHTAMLRGRGSAGRALRSQRKGRGFESRRLHYFASSGRSAGDCPLYRRCPVSHIEYPANTLRLVEHKAKVSKPDQSKRGQAPGDGLEPAKVQGFFCFFYFGKFYLENLKRA